MTSNGNQYSVAEPNIYGFENKEEKEALIKTDPTKLKEYIRYYIVRTQDLRKEVDEKHIEWEEKRIKYRKQINAKEDEISAVTKDINGISTNIQMLKNPFELQKDDLQEMYTKQHAYRELELKQVSIYLIIIIYLCIY